MTNGDKIQLASLIIGTLTLILGIIAYFTFLKNRFKEKQLDAVCDLVREIHNGYNLVLVNKEGKPTTYWMTLFDIAVSKDFDGPFNFYTFSQGENQKLEDVLNWRFFSYYNNPLIPKGIAEQLSKFNIRFWKSVRYSEIKNSSIIMGRKGSIDDEWYCMYYEDKKTARDFKSCCYLLKDAIDEWLSDARIKDLNLSHSHHKKD